MTALTPPAPGTSSASIAPLRGSAVPRPKPVGGALAAYEHMWLLYRRTWRGSIFGNFAQPVLFLVAMGIGLGSYVNQADPASLQGVPYLQFLAPALLVSTVMQGSTFEATFPVLGGFRWVRRYHAMYATRSARTRSRSARSPGSRPAPRSSPRSSRS